MTTEWTEPKYHGVPCGDPIEIPLSVSGDDHPGAIVTALKAPRALAAYQHIDELADLPQSELYYLLVDVHKLAGVIAALEDELIIRHREAGASWSDLAAALELTSRQTAKDRYLKVKRANARGLNTRGLADEEEAEGRTGGVTQIVSGNATVAHQVGVISSTFISELANLPGMQFGRQEPTSARRPADCRCQCDHGDGGICLSCGCRCEAADPDVCPCCGADDRTLPGR